MKMSELHDVVIRRDRVCVAALYDLGHQCRDRWGEPHFAGEVNKLTLEHVKDRQGRRIDHPHACIALCHDANVNQHWSSANHAEALLYLAGVVAGERVHER